MPFPCVGVSWWEVGMEVLVAILVTCGDSLPENEANDKESRDGVGRQLTWSVHPGQVQPQIRSPDSQFREPLLSLLFLSQIELGSVSCFHT